MSRFGEKILSMLSPKTAGDAFGDPTLSLPVQFETIKKRSIEKKSPEKFLENINLNFYAATFPNFYSYILGKRVLDFGCGEGAHTIALAKAGASFAFGLDKAPYKYAYADVYAREHGLSGVVEFGEILRDVHDGFFDTVISMNAFEHFSDAAGVLQNMRRLLKPGCALLLSFGPPWYSPSGVHNYFFIRIPWANILFSEKTIMKVRRKYIDEDKHYYHEISLNKMSVKKYETIMRNSDLRFVYRQYDCIKRMNFLATIPLVRELFVNRITCILRRD